MKIKYLKAYKELQKFWICLTSVGTDKPVEEGDLKYVRYTNVVAVLTTLAVFLYIPYSLFTGNYLLAALQAVDTFCVLLVLGFNHKGYHKPARHLYFVVVNVFVLINSCFIGPQSGVQDFFYISYVVPFLLFSVKDYKNIIAGVLIPIGFFYLYRVVSPYFAKYNLDVPTQLHIANVNVWMKFVLFGLAIYILAYYNYKTENQLKRSYKIVREQTEELARSNKDLEQFAFVISHDMKTPVSNIGSFMGILKQNFSSALPPAGVQLVEQSETSAKRLANQIDDLLAYCKVDRNLPPAAHVDLNFVVDTINIEFGDKLRSRNAEIIVEKPLPVLGQLHTSMIHHVFQNLIANGIKFNTNEHPVVSIGWKVSDEGTLLFSVTDNGIGIDSRYKDKLFQMFRRLHNSSQFEGTGIGLAVCRKIINYYNGEIWFDSVNNQGTTFYFSLPVAMLEGSGPLESEKLYKVVERNMKQKKSTPLLKRA